MAEEPRNAQAEMIGEAAISARGASLKKIQEDADNETPAGHEDFEKRKQGAVLAAEENENVGRKQYFELRRRWATFLMWALGATGVFQGFFVYLVGVGYWPFKDHEVFLNTVGAELFLQIAAMCLIVVRCLFPSTEAERKEKR